MRLINKVSMMSGIVGILALGGTAVYAAGLGYSPSATTAPFGTSGGFTQVVTAKSVSPTATTSTNIAVTVDNGFYYGGRAAGNFFRSRAGRGQRSGIEPSDVVFILTGFCGVLSHRRLGCECHQYVRTTDCGYISQANQSNDPYLGD